jgi:hypothetical protein
MRQAKFCLAPYGHGWGIRLSIVVAAGCVPVIIQVRRAGAAAQPHYPQLQRQRRARQHGAARAGTRRPGRSAAAPPSQHPIISPIISTPQPTTHNPQPTTHNPQPTTHPRTTCSSPTRTSSHTRTSASGWRPRTCPTSSSCSRACRRRSGSACTRASRSGARLPAAAGWLACAVLACCTACIPAAVLLPAGWPGTASRLQAAALTQAGGGRRLARRWKPFVWEEDVGGTAYQTTLASLKKRLVQRRAGFFS